MKKKLIIFSIAFVMLFSVFLVATKKKVGATTTPDFNITLDLTGETDNIFILQSAYINRSNNVVMKTTTQADLFSIHDSEVVSESEYKALFFNGVETGLQFKSYNLINYWYDIPNDTMNIFASGVYVNETTYEPSYFFNDAVYVSITSFSDYIGSDSLVFVYSDTFLEKRDVGPGEITLEQAITQMYNMYSSFINSDAFVGYYKNAYYNYGIYNQLTPAEVEEQYQSNITLWIWAVIDAISGFFSIQIGSVSLGAIVLIPFAITFAWFIIKQFRGGGD